MVAYDLSHLTQKSTQEVAGPVQDDEAMFLFALIRVMLIRRVLEIGGLSGYSARNFVQAVGRRGVVYTVDTNPVRAVARNGRHRPIQLDAALITAAHVDNQPLDLVFFDCHDFDAQMALYRRLTAAGIITDRTVIALHDTALHPTAKPRSGVEYELPGGGWRHQPVECRIVNVLHADGWDCVSLDTDLSRHDADLPFRHGLTIARRFPPGGLPL